MFNRLKCNRKMRLNKAPQMHKMIGFPTPKIGFFRHSPQSAVDMASLKSVRVEKLHPCK